ncbi:MAG: hypothetical protein VKK59_02150 [Vampirovibrionales bacterium]|nr:hypothetical protein [Vampirovibrionales bacterium]
MSQLNRLHQGDITNGNLIDAAQINAEFNQLVSESNAQDNRLNIVETANLTISGVKTFTDGIKSPTMTLTGTPTVAGQIGSANNNLMHHNGSGVAVVETTLNQGFIILEDRKPAGTNGGTFTAGARRTRVLNTEVVDAGNHCTLANNQFILAAGTYRVYAESTAFMVDGHRCWVRNVTDGVDVALGMSAFSASTTLNGNTVATAWGRFTITAPKTFELQARCFVTNLDDGFGVQANAMDTEVYSRVTLWKEAA